MHDLLAALWSRCQCGFNSGQIVAYEAASEQVSCLKTNSDPASQHHNICNCENRCASDDQQQSPEPMRVHPCYDHRPIPEVGHTGKEEVPSSRKQIEGTSDEEEVTQLGRGALQSTQC